MRIGLPATEEVDELPRGESVDIVPGGLCVCVGGGEIGRGAALAALAMGACVVIVDLDPGCAAADIVGRSTTSLAALHLDQRGGAQLLVEEGITGLMAIMDLASPEVIVPGVPGHMAARLAVRRAAERGLELLPDPDGLRAITSSLPGGLSLSIFPEAGLLATSFAPAGMECPRDCSQPALCPLNGRRHATPMHDILETALMQNTERAVVLISRPLGRFGAIEGGAVGALLRNVDSMVGGQSLGVATSCRCHGIANVLRAVPGPKGPRTTI